MLKLYSLQRRRDRYTIIYVWKILESIVPNLNIPITCYSSIRRGRLCAASHVGIGHLGTLVCHSFRFRGIRLFNAMPKQIRDLSCSVSSFKYQPGLGSSTVDQVLKYTKYPKYIPSTSTGQVLIFLKKYLSTSSTFISSTSTSTHIKICSKVRIDIQSRVNFGWKK